MTQRKEFDHALGDLRVMLTEMGSQMERALLDAVEALKNLDMELANRVVENDRIINQYEEKIDEAGSRLIATQQPVAKDLRRILVAFRIAADLERMADLSVDIAKVVLRLQGQTFVKPLLDIPRMAELVPRMVGEAIASYVGENVDLAYKSAKTDDEVDQLYGQILRESFALMVENPKTVGQAILLSMVARYIERIADHATNISESVVYLVTGKRPELN